MADDPFASLKSALSERYRIEREIDRGGMAVVFLAEDLTWGDSQTTRICLRSILSIS